MKKIFLLVLVTAMFAATTAMADETLKIGYIDLQRALVESEAGKKAKVDLDSIEKSKKAVIDEKVKSINKIEEELGKQSSVLSPEARKVREEEMERLQRDFQRLVADARAELQKKEQELTDAILKDMSEIVDVYGKEEGYTIIVRSEVILHAKKELDITDVIIKKFNEVKEKSPEVRRGEKDEPKEKPKEKSKGKK